MGLEVLVIDSGSRDHSVDIARAAGVSVLEIEPASFGHGRTRNMGAPRTSGELVGFLTQDATPVRQCRESDHVEAGDSCRRRARDGLARLAVVQPWLAVLCILAVALALRLGFVFATPGYTPRHDDRHYDRLACTIVIAGHYPVRPADADRESCGSMPAGRNAPTAFRPPGYPVFLAGVHVAGDPLPVERWTRARVANALLGTLAVALVGLIAMHFWSRRVALVAMAVMAVDLPLILVGGSLMSETLFVALVLGAVLAALQSGTARRPIAWAVGAGVLIGLATLTRPTGLVLAIPLGLAVARRSPRRPAAALVLVIAIAMTIAPWTARNAVQMHAFIPVSDFTGSWVAGTYNEQARADKEHPGSSQTFVAGEFDDLEGVPEVERQRELTRRGLEYAADHPGYVAQVLLHNTMRLLNLEGSSWWRRKGGGISLPIWATDAAAYAFYAIALLALAGALTPAARRAPRWLWLAPILLFASVILAGSAIRYRAPIEPFLALLAALALTARERQQPLQAPRCNGHADGEP